MKTDYYWKEVIKLAQKAAKKGEVPVGAILVGDNLKIIARNYNKREKKHDILGHAEILCIKKANKCMRTWKLDNLDLYVSLKPCKMCEEVIRQSRIRNVYYLLDKEKNKVEYYKTNIQKFDSQEYAKEYQMILTNFFKKMR